MRFRSRVALLSSVVVLIAGCGGERGSILDTSTTEAPPTGSATSPTSSTDTSPRVLAYEVDPSEAPEGMCGRLLAQSEIEAFIGAPAPFEDVPENGFDADLGAVICSWSSLDETGLPIETVAVQLYLGDPVPGEAFYTPELFPEIRTVDDIGESAFFASELLRRTAEFLDGEVVGIIDYWPFGVEGVEGLASGDDLIALLRTLHERVFDSA